ncbi:MAG: histidine phosphatase family protein [Candidatus Sedimenticola sp. 20ELBAFRAG]
MPRVIAALIRHGDYQQLAETPSAHQPFPLTPEGEAQARQAATELAQTIDTNDWTLSPEVDSSQLLRAWQTARIISDELSGRFPIPPKLTCYNELAERGLGSAANLTLSQIEKIIREDPRFPELPADWKSNSRFRLPLQGAESLMEAGERVAVHLREQMKHLSVHAGNDTLKLFVGHGAAFRHAAHHLGILSFEQIAKLSMFHAKPVFLEYLPGGEWRHIAGEWKVRGRQSEYTD